MKEFNSYIEHTLLHQNSTRQEIENHCREAIEFAFSSICIPPYFVREINNLLSDNKDIQLWTVIAYPMGYAPTIAKVEEIKKVKDNGAFGVEIMINVAAVLDNNWSYVTNDIKSSVTTAQLKGLASKVILKPSLLKSKDLQLLCKICIDAEADYIISDSNFDDHLMDVQSIKLLKRFVGDKIKLQASGQISSRDHIAALIENGANKISSGKDLYLFNEKENG